MTYRLLFLDIDGTILQPDHTYTDSTKEAISQVQLQGVEVFLATGRPSHEISDIAEDFQIDSIIGYNGAYATYKNEIIVNEPMNVTTVEHFLHIARKNNHQALLYTQDTNYFTSLTDPSVKQSIELFQLKKNKVFVEEAADKVLGITLINVNPAELAQYKLDANIHLSPVHLKGAENNVDLIRKNVNKGEAINVLLSRLNIPKEQAIAFGDGMNDKEMLQAVGEGFAMENAHPELFSYAKHQTTSVENSGIFTGLKKLGLVN